MDVVVLIVQFALAATFAAAAVGKLLHPDLSRRALGDFGAPRPLIGPLAVALPLAEAAIAVGLIFDVTARYAAIAAILLLSVFCAAIARANAHGSQPDCNCFGQVTSTPAGPRTLLRNAFLALGALGVAVAGPTASLTDVPALAFVGAAVALQGWVSWELFRQNGRLLERVASLEERGGAPAPSASGPQGLSVGEVAPAFELRRPDGGVFGLSGLVAEGRPVALAFSDSQCGACAELPALLERMRAVRRGEITIAALVRARTADERSQLSGDDAVETLLVEDDDLFESYEVRRLPSLTVVDEDGLIASPTVAGIEAIETLLATTGGRASMQVLTRAAGV